MCHLSASDRVCCQNSTQSMHRQRTDRETSQNINETSHPGSEECIYSRVPASTTTFTPSHSHTATAPENSINQPVNQAPKKHPASRIVIPPAKYTVPKTPYLPPSRYLPIPLTGTHQQPAPNQQPVHNSDCATKPTPFSLNKTHQASKNTWPALPFKHWKPEGMEWHLSAHGPCML